MSCISFSWLRGKVSGTQAIKQLAENRELESAIEFVCFLSFFLSFLFLFLPTFSIFPLYLYLSFIKLVKPVRHNTNCLEKNTY